MSLGLDQVSKKFCKKKKLIKIVMLRFRQLKKLLKKQRKKLQNITLNLMCNQLKLCLYFPILKFVWFWVSLYKLKRYILFHITQFLKFIESTKNEQ